MWNSLWEAGEPGYNFKFECRHHEWSFRSWVQLEQMWLKSFMRCVRSDSLTKGYRSIHPSILWTYLKNAMREFLQSWHIRSKGWTDEVFAGQKSRSLWLHILWTWYLKFTLREFLQTSTGESHLPNMLAGEYLEGICSKLVQTFPWSKGLNPQKSTFVNWCSRFLRCFWVFHIWNAESHAPSHLWLGSSR